MITPHEAKLIIEMSVGFFSKQVQWNIAKEND